MQNLQPKTGLWIDGQVIGGREVSKALKKSSFLKAKTKNAYDL